jgi:hypothetical protein
VIVGRSGAGMSSSDLTGSLVISFHVATSKLGQLHCPSASELDSSRPRARGVLRYGYDRRVLSPNTGRVMGQARPGPEKESRMPAWPPSGPVRATR